MWNWNCSAPHSLLLQQYGDDYARCESSSSSAGSVGLDRILAAEYGRFDSLNLSPPLHGLQAQTLFAMHGSENYLGIGANPIYSSEARPAFSQLSFTQPAAAAAAAAAHYSMKWTAAGETVTGDGSRLIRGSKRLKTTTPATAQGPQHFGQRCNPKPTRNQSMKAPCKRNQKLGDKITALQQLVSPYGKTDTASVLHEAATCIKHLHEQIQILTASYPEFSSSESQQDTGEEDGGATDLRRQGLCVAPLSPAVVQVVTAEAALRHHDAACTEDHWRCLGTL